MVESTAPNSSTTIFSARAVSDEYIIRVGKCLVTAKHWTVTDRDDAITELRGSEISAYRGTIQHAQEAWDGTCKLRKRHLL